MVFVDFRWEKKRTKNFQPIKNFRKLTLSKCFGCVGWFVHEVSRVYSFIKNHPWVDQTKIWLLKSKIISYFAKNSRFLQPSSSRMHSFLEDFLSLWGLFVTNYARPLTFANSGSLSCIAFA